jgi:hypothetical protein
VSLVFEVDSFIVPFHSGAVKMLLSVSLFLFIVAPVYSPHELRRTQNGLSALQSLHQLYM